MYLLLGCLPEKVLGRQLGWGGRTVGNVPSFFTCGPLDIAAVVHFADPLCR